MHIKNNLGMPRGHFSMGADLRQDEWTMSLSWCILLHTSIIVSSPINQTQKEKEKFVIGNDEKINNPWAPAAVTFLRPHDLVTILKVLQVASI